MARQPETRLQQSIQKALRKRWPHSFWFKHWGGPFSPAGIPDLIGCVDGLFFALEIKLPKKQSKTSAIQDETIADIVRAGGHSTVIRSVAEALEFVERHLDNAVSRTTSRPRVRTAERRGRIVRGATNRQNVHHDKAARAPGRRPVLWDIDLFAHQQGYDLAR